MRHRWSQYIAVGLTAGITVIFSLLVFLPQHRELGRLRAATRSMKSELARRAADASQLPDVRKRLELADELLAGYHSRIPANPKVGDFVEEVSGIAERLGLSNQNITPLAPERRGPVTALPIRISFDADFEASFEFLQKIEGLPRVVRVTELVVEHAAPDKTPAPNNGEGLHTDLTVEVYYEAAGEGSCT